jgi:hypothetical protein
MHNTYAGIIEVVSDMFFSGSSYQSREVKVLHSHPDTLRDMQSCCAWQSIVKRE